MDNTEEFRCISLCTGYVGIELGLRQVIPNLRTVAYVEIEAFACANLVAKIEEGKLDAAPIWTDIKTFDGRSFRDRVHLITGGYPCQPFSYAGKRKGTADPRHLWPHIEGIIAAVRPVWCFFENVSGHLTIGFPSVYRSLRNLGYQVEAGLFTAAEVGASFSGERLFILAKANGVRELQSQGCKQNKRGWFNNGGKKTLAETKSQRRETSQQSRTYATRPRFADSSSHVNGVALQDEEQYDWEEPREIKPRLDGTIDGIRNWNDRLRLLGNGVVPQCTEKAFRTLMALFGATDGKERTSKTN